MHFYFQVRIFSMSNMFFMVIGAVCISLKGVIAPIWIAILFDQLEGVNNHLCSLMHGSQEIRENLVALQKLINLEDIK
jgi:hypothetical protein